MSATWERADDSRRLEMLLSAFFRSREDATSRAVGRLIRAAETLSDLAFVSVGNVPAWVLERAALSEARLWDRVDEVVSSGRRRVETYEDLGYALPELLRSDVALLWAPTTLSEVTALNAIKREAFLSGGRGDADDPAFGALRLIAEAIDFGPSSSAGRRQRGAERLARARWTLERLDGPDGYLQVATLALRLTKRCRTERAAKIVLETTPEWAELYHLQVTRKSAVQKGTRPGEKLISRILRALAAFRWVRGRRGLVSARNVAAALLYLEREALSPAADRDRQPASGTTLARKAIALRRSAESIVREARRPARSAPFRRELSEIPHGMRPSPAHADEPESRRRTTEQEESEHDQLPDNERGGREAPHLSAGFEALEVQGHRAPVREAESLPMPVRRGRPRGVHAGEDVLLDRRGDRQPRDRRGRRVKEPP